MSWQTWILSFIPWVLPLGVAGGVLLLVAKGERRQWAVNRRWWIALSWAVWYALWVSVALVAASEGKNPWLSLGAALLRGLWALGNVLWTPWFLLCVFILVRYGRQVGDLLTRIAQNAKTVEVSGLKISFGDLAPAMTGLSVGWWSDKPDGGSGTSDAAGSDGPLQEKPFGPDAAYEKCLREAEPLLAGMIQVNHWERGRQLQALEWSWIGEYAEQLEQSVRLLRQAVREQRILRYEYRYLATGLPIRHMMLYMYGRLEHAQQLFDDLGAIDPPSLVYVFKEPLTYWFLIHLCDRRQFDYAQRLLSLCEFQDSELFWTGRALKAYLDLKLTKYSEAVCDTEKALAGLNPTAPEVALPRMLLRYVAAMASLKVGIPGAAIAHTEAIRREDSVAAVGLRSYLQRHAIRLYVQACFQLKRYESINQLRSEDPAAAIDPFVLNALAVARYTQGDAKTAASFLMQAVDLLPPDGDEELCQTILANREVLNV